MSDHEREQDGDIVWQDEPNPANKSQSQPQGMEVNPAQNSPLPWNSVGTIVGDGNRCHVATCVMAEDAKFIAHCVNSHAKMREAFKVAMFALTSPIGDSEDALTAIIGALEELK